MTVLRSKITMIALGLLICLVGWNFKTNGLGIAPEPFFQEFQTNGQARVIGGMYAQAHQLDQGTANFGHVARMDAVPDDRGHIFNTERTMQAISGADQADDLQAEHYTAHFGGQALVYGWLQRLFGVTDFAVLQWVPALLTALVIGLLSRSYGRLFHPLFGVLFFVGLAASPWFVAFARNLYWNPFLLFLPGLFAAWAVQQRSIKVEALLVVLVAIAVTLKSLSNYEYLTCVIVLACAPYLIAPHFGRVSISWRQGIVRAAIVFVLCCAGFVAALGVHAAKRGDGAIMAGLTTMYEEDISRRTYGPSDGLVGETAESLNASVTDVFVKYYKLYPELRRTLIPRKVTVLAFGLLIIGMLFALIVDRRRFPWGPAWLVATFVAVPVSWMIAAKGHAYTQTHIGFVTLYFGFFQAMIFGVLTFGLHDLSLIKDRFMAIGNKETQL